MSIEDLSVQGIKDRARKEIPSLIKGASPSATLSTTRKFGESALLNEDPDQEKTAFYQYQKVIS